MSTKYILAWVDNLDVIYSEGHHFNEQDIFSLNISQSEGQFAVCEIEIENPGLNNLLNLGNRNAIISFYENGVYQELFRGSVVDIPTQISGDYVIIELIAKKSSTKDDMKAVAETYKNGEYYDELFVDWDDEEDPTLAIEALPAHFYVDRKTLDVEVSFDYATDPILDIGPNWFDQSLNIQIDELPVEKLKYKVIAEWETTAVGNVNIAGIVKNRFYGAGNAYDFRTATPDDFEANFPGTGADFVGNTGWTFVSNDLQKADIGEETVRAFDSDPGATGFYSADLQYTKYTLNNLLVRYEYRQPRREILNIELNADIQNVFGQDGVGAGTTTREETMDDIVLNDILEDRTTPDWEAQKVYVKGDEVRHNGVNWICENDHVSGDTFKNLELVGITQNNITMTYWVRKVGDNSALQDARRTAYFQTDRGLKSVATAVEIGRTYLTRRARFINITFTGAFEDLHEVDTSMSLRIESDKIPGGAAVGKVISYSIVVDDTGDRYVEITLGVSVGASLTFSESGTNLEQSEYVADSFDLQDYDIDAYFDYYTPSAVGVNIEVEKIKKPVNAFFLGSPDYAVTRSEVTNQYAEQKNYAVAASQNLLIPDQNSTAEFIEKAVSQRPTRLQIEMRKISPDEIIETNYQVKTKDGENVEILKGINLDGGTGV